MPLTDTAIRNFKPQAKPVKVSDERGMYMLVSPSGGKLFRFKYRFGGKEKAMPLGRYPDVSLSQARDRREAARKLLATGVDPMEQRKAEKVARKFAMENSFAAVGQQWWENWKGARSERHAEYVRRRLESDVFPAIGARPIAEIEAPELVRMAKTIEARGALDIAKRSLQMTSQIFRFAIAHGLATRNPATDIRPSDVLKSRIKENFARVDTRELPALLQRIDLYAGVATTRVAMKLMAMTFVRTSELIGARWDP